MVPGGRPAWLAALSATLVCASSAGAYTVTLGPSEIPSAPPTEGFVCKQGCSGPYTVAQLSSSFVDAAPASGVITSWRVNAEKDGAVALRVLEPAPGGSWIGAGTSTAANDLAGGPNATELAISRGDLIGVDVGEAAFVGAKLFAGATGGEILSWEPLIEEGGGGRAPKSESGSNLLFLSAAVELTPIVTSVSPASGSTAGGDTVTITGKYLDSALNVVFGSRPASTFSVDLSGERITAITPASTAGTVDVKVSNLHSTSEAVAADRFTFVAPTSTGPAPPGGGGGGAAPSATPVVTGFTESAERWRLGSSLPHVASAPVGTAFAFRLNEAASVALRFVRVLPGRRVAGRCVAPTRGNRSRTKCRRNLSAGSLAVAGHAGLNTVRFEGRLSRNARLTPGNYTAGVTTLDSHGLKSLTRPLSFTIVP